MEPEITLRPGRLLGSNHPPKRAPRVYPPCRQAGRFPPNTALRDARKAAGMTQVELAVRASVSRQAVMCAESGDRPLTQVIARVLATILDVQPDTLFDRSGYTEEVTFIQSLVVRYHAMMAAPDPRMRSIGRCMYPVLQDAVLMLYDTNAAWYGTPSDACPPPADMVSYSM